MLGPHRSSGAGGGVGSRREARETALEILYSADRRGEEILDVLHSQLIELPEHARDLVYGVAEHTRNIDLLIDEASEGWRTDRMPAIDRALLRMAVFEIVHRIDVPIAAVLAELVELAGDYSTGRSAQFLNGVAAKISSIYRSDSV